jgi:hypothetical protein
MELKNGYKVIYEVAADGKRTFYASKSNVYPTTEDVEIASFNDADYKGKVIYEYKGDFYVSAGSIPAYNENGVPTDNKITEFEKIFCEHVDNDANGKCDECKNDMPAEAAAYTRRSRKSAPVVEEPVVESGEPEVAPVEE